MVEKIKKKLEEGFRPFAIGLTDGRRYEIPHRDFILASSRDIGIIDKDDLIITINPLHIVSLDDLQPEKV